jgi:hypothetical protein
MSIPKEGDILNVKGITVMIVKHPPREDPCDGCVLYSICDTGRRGFICPTHLKPVPVEDMI